MGSETSAGAAYDRGDAASAAIRTETDGPTAPPPAWPFGEHGYQLQLPAGPPVAEPTPPEPAPRRWRRLRLSLALVAVAGLAGWAGWATWVMLENEDRALSWQTRAETLEGANQRLEAILSARTKTLNQRISQLNTLGRKLAATQGALSSSEADVSSLEQRQRELADEKAQLEDQAHTLDRVAASYINCKNDLISLLNNVSDGYDTYYAWNQASASCTVAERELQSYLDIYPNG